MVGASQEARRLEEEGRFTTREAARITTMPVHTGRAMVHGSMVRSPNGSVLRKGVMEDKFNDELKSSTFYSTA